MLIKLTDQDGQTHGGMQWGPGVTHGPTSGEGELCGPGWLHLYEGLGVALLHNPIGANFLSPRAWRARARVERRQDLKAGTRTLTTIEEITFTPPTTEQLVTVAVLLAFDHYNPIQDQGMWGAWAVDWLSGNDRSAGRRWRGRGRRRRRGRRQGAYITHVNAVACAVFGF